MDDAGFMRGFERLGDLPRNRDGLVERHGPLCDPVGQRRAVDQLQDQGGDRARFLETVDRADVGMVQRRQHLRFALEPGQPVRVGGHRRRQHLDCDVALQLAIAGAVDLAHSARAEGRGNRVRPEDCAGRERHHASIISRQGPAMWAILV